MIIYIKLASKLPSWLLISSFIKTMLLFSCGQHWSIYLNFTIKIWSPPVTYWWYNHISKIPRILQNKVFHSTIHLHIVHVCFSYSHTINDNHNSVIFVFLIINHFFNQVWHHIFSQQFRCLHGNRAVENLLRFMDSSGSKIKKYHQI